MEPPEALVIIPTLNEAAHIRQTLLDLLDGGGPWPIVVADGGSRDGTQAIVRAMAQDHPTLRLVTNPGRTQAHGVNLGGILAAQAGAGVLIRADAHARYPSGFVRGLIDTLTQQDANSVVVPLVATDTGDPWQTAAAALQRSWLGHGGAAHRQTGQAGWVDHGHHAAFRLSAFRVLGGYDTTFAANEDAEFDARLRAAGGRIYLQPRWAVGYLPRSGPGAIWRQYRRNGHWRGETILRHGQMQARQVLPCALTILLLASVLLTPLHPLALVPVWGYAVALLILGYRIAGRLGGRVAVLAALSHLGFGTGMLETLARAALRPSPRRVPA